MNLRLIAGIILLLVGVILFVVGINASDSVADRLSNFFTGHFTDATVWYMVGGIAAAVGGLMLALLGSRRSMT